MTLLRRNSQAGKILYLNVSVWTKERRVMWVSCQASWIDHIHLNISHCPSENPLCEDFFMVIHFLWMTIKNWWWSCVCRCVWGSDKSLQHDAGNFQRVRQPHLLWRLSVCTAWCQRSSGFQGASKVIAVRRLVLHVWVSRSSDSPYPQTLPSPWAFHLKQLLVNLL